MTIVRLTPRRLTEAVAALSAQDPKMAVAIERVGPCTMLPRADGTHFEGFDASDLTFRGVDFTGRVIKTADEFARLAQARNVA